MSLVSVDDVSYGYLPPDLNSSPFSDGPAPDRQTAEQLRGITMTIEPGTLTLLVGASGSGKSTLLRTMNGLVPKFYGGTLRGRVTVHGIDLADVELHDVGRTSAMIFQNPHTQFFTSSVRTELAFGLENYGVDAADIREAVTRAVARTGISHLLDRQLDTLSGGELQRVACACALAADVDLLLFDEPTSNLSAEGIDDFRTLVMELMDAGKTLVIAEHRLHLFRGLANVVNRISDGQIVERMSGDDFFVLRSVGRRSAGAGPTQHRRQTGRSSYTTTCSGRSFSGASGQVHALRFHLGQPRKTVGRADYRAPHFFLPPSPGSSRHRLPVFACWSGDDPDRCEWRRKVDSGSTHLWTRKSPARGPYRHGGALVPPASVRNGVGW